MGMSWLDVVEALTDAVNGALEVGDWSEVVRLTTELYTAALHIGDAEFADLVQDLHWIANDALVHPMEAGRWVSP
jgi:hypothetical protein